MKEKISISSLSFYTRVTIASDEKCSHEILSVLAYDRDTDVRVAVAKNINTGLDILLVLVHDDCSVVRKAIAMRSNLPKEICTEFINEDTESVLRELVENPNSTGELLEAIARTTKNQFTKKYIIKHENVTTNILSELSDDDDFIIREEVARNIKTPLEILEKLAFDIKISVRECAVCNINVSNEILEKLARRETWDTIRISIAKSPKASDKLIRELKNDSDMHVRNAARENLDERLRKRKKG